MSRRSSTARAQLIKASAGPTAQLVHANATQVGGGSAPIMSAPTAQIPHRSPNPNLPTPVEVGGGTKKAAGYAKQTSTVGGVDLTLHQMRDGSFQLRDANGNIRKKYSSTDMDFIRRRGNSGATLDENDAAAFARFSGQKTAREIAFEDEQRKAQAAAEVAANKQRFDAAQKELDRQAQTQRTLATQQAAIGRQELRNQGAAERQQMQIDAAAAKAEEVRRQKEIDNGRTSDMTDEDYARWMQMGGNKGWATFDYSAAAKKEMEDQERELRDNLAKGFLNQSDYEAMRDAMHETWSQNGLYKKEVQRKENMPTDEPIYSADKRSIWDPSKGQTGGWVAAPTDQVQARADQIAARKEEREIAAKNAQQARRDKYEQSIIDSLTTEEKDNDGDVIKPGMPYEEAVKEARRRADIFFNREQEKPREWFDPELPEGHYVGEKTMFNGLGRGIRVFNDDDDPLGLIMENGQQYSYDKDGNPVLLEEGAITPWAKPYMSDPKKTGAPLVSWKPKGVIFEKDYTQDRQQ